MRRVNPKAVVEAIVRHGLLAASSFERTRATKNDPSEFHVKVHFIKREINAFCNDRLSTELARSVEEKDLLAK